VYAQERLPKTRAADKAAHNISNLTPFWGKKRTDDVNSENCAAFALNRPPAAARRDLEVLRAALLYRNKHKAPLSRIPAIVMTDKSPPRERCFTQAETRRLRKAAMKYPHLYRFVILGLKTGSRSGVLLSLRWDQIDLERGVMDRKALGETEAGNKRKPPVRLGRAVVRLMRRWKAKDGKIKHVVHYDGLPIKKLRRSWAAACKEAEITGASPHTLRHTRATWLMQAGIDPWEAAGSLGMTLSVLEKTYGKHSPDFQSRAAEV